MLSQSLTDSGSEKPHSNPVCLTCGPLSLWFDPGWAWLRNIRVLGKEAIQAIYPAVRDQYWNTVKPRLSNLRIIRTEESVEIDFDARYQEGEIDFAWKGRVGAKADGTLVFEMEGKTLTSFLKNRLGFCVLHPLDCSGVACTLEKVDGAVERARFPYYISPDQPFQNLRGLSYQLLDGLTIETRFEGDVFETEDQRNWTDASYKTYCTPLGLPYPVLINAGEQVQQSVKMRLIGELPRTAAVSGSSSHQSTLAPAGTDPLPLPRLGLCLSSESLAQSEASLARVRRLHLAHVRVDVDLGREGWERVLADGASQADNLGTRLELAVHVPPDAEIHLSLLASQLAGLGERLSACLVFDRASRCTPSELIRLARGVLGPVLGGVPLGGGSNVYFAELNRNRPSEPLDLVCYPINPQVHAFDDESLLQTPPTQAWTAQTARTFLGSVPLAVTPITLRPGVNPNVGERSTEKPGTIPESVDCRQVSLLGAVWTIASIKHLAESGVASATYYETIGWRGVMETEEGNPSPFPSIPGSVYPLYHVFADVGEYRQGVVIPTISTARPGVEGLLLLKEKKRRLILFNSTPALQSVKICGCGLNGDVRLKALDETTADEARRRPEVFREVPGLRTEVRDDRVTLGLLPYAVVTVDSDR